MVLLRSWLRNIVNVQHPETRQCAQRNNIAKHIVDIFHGVTPTSILRGECTQTRTHSHAHLFFVLAFRGTCNAFRTLQHFFGSNCEWNVIPSSHHTLACSACVRQTTTSTASYLRGNSRDLSGSMTSLQRHRLSHHCEQGHGQERSTVCSNGGFDA